MDDQSERFLKAADSLSIRMIDAEISKYEALELMGMLIESEIKKTMTNLRHPPNAPATIRKKGSDNPLIDQGILRSSIRFVIKSADDNPLGGD